MTERAAGDGSLSMRIGSTFDLPRLARFIFVGLALGLALTSTPLVAAAAAEPSERLVIATRADGLLDARHVQVLVDGLRAHAGPHRDATVYVVVDDVARAILEREPGEGVVLVDASTPAVAERAPFAAKAYAAAQVEALVAGRATTMVWLDAAVVVLGPIPALDLGADHDVAFRPVTLVNGVGLAPDAPLDRFWRGVYEATGAGLEGMPVVRAIVDDAPMRYYVNAEVYAIRPSLGIAAHWARSLTALLENDSYLREACSERLHRIFLHQAVLAGAVLSRTEPVRRRDLPLDHGYPLQSHARVPAALRAASLDDVRIGIVDALWRQNPGWLDAFDVSEPRRAWLLRAHLSTLRLTSRLFREEASCNSYLYRGDGGDVVIDTGGARTPASALFRLHGATPLRAILLTHGHEDHRGGIALWRGERDVPVIAHERLPAFLAAEDLIAPFLARRTAIIAGTPPPASFAPTPVEATVFFRDRYVLGEGESRVEIIHTPGETPDTSTVWIPSEKAVIVADNFYTAFPNAFTPRGSMPRWPLEYVAALETALSFDAELLLPGHGEPIVGRERVRRALTDYRDAILFVHDAVVRGINEGADVYTLMRTISLPERFQLGHFYGRVSWFVRGLYQLYTGWFDGNVASFYAEPPASILAELVTMAGGPSALAAKSRAALASGDPVRALHFADAALRAEGQNADALAARTAALEALMQRSGNYLERRFLAGALREVESGAR